MKNYKKAILASLAMVGTSCAIISGATFALFSNESTTNIAITSGKIDVQATGTVSSYYTVSGGAKTEGEWSNGDVTVEGSLVSVNNIYHGEGVILDIKVENKSSINVKYQVSLTGVAAYAVSSNGVYKNVKVSTVESAVDFVSVGNGTYLTNWTSVVAPETTTHISVDIRLPEYADNYDGSSCEYTIGVNAVQGNKHVEDPESVEPKVTEGLQFTLINGGTAYSVAGIGEATDTDIIIPDEHEGKPVTEIGYQAFFGNEKITSVTLPDGITAIQESAFSGCNNLTNVEIPDTVTYFGALVFNGCSKIESITIPAGVEQILERTFMGCVSLKNVTFAANSQLTSIEYRAFMGCTELTNIVLPNKVVNIGESSFHDCISLTSITIPASVKQIGQIVFQGCSSLTSVTFEETRGWVIDETIILGNELKDPETAATYLTSTYCTYKWVRFEDLGTEGLVIKNGAVTGYEGTDTDVIIPDTYYGTPVTSVGSNAFQGCEDITSVTLPDSITSIGGYAFEGCTNLQSVNIPDDVTSIGQYTFSKCSSLESITIPDGVTTIDRYAFDKTSSLKSITIPDSVTSISGYAFLDSGIESVTFGENCQLETITGYVFQNCKNLKSVTIPKSVTSIGYSAFNGCDSLESVEILGEVTSIGGRAFFGCRSLTSIVIPASVEIIEAEAFWGSGLKNVYYCGEIGSVELVNGENTQVIPKNATFYYYSEENPFDNGVEDGNFWHYDNGEIVVWTKN